MKAHEARELGERVAALVEADKIERAYALLTPVLAERTPFAKLDLIGAAVGAGSLEKVNRILECMAEDQTEGGWPVIGSALRQQLKRDLPGVFARSRKFIVAANVWYGADILGERVPGPALEANFEPALLMLTSWRSDPNVWVRRAVGVAVHYWAKRSRGKEKLAPQAETLLEFLEPMFEEWEMDAVKGIGWGLKTLGRGYPELLAGWLSRQLPRRHRSIMARKALTYLNEEQTRQVIQTWREV